MGKNTTTETPIFKSRISFMPLIRTWQEASQHGREGNREYYKQLLEEIHSRPDLVKPIDNNEILKDHSLFIERMMATVFPVTLSDEQDLFAVLQPFNHRALYSSKMFHQMFLDEEEYIRMPDETMAKKLEAEKIGGAYQLVLNRFYNIKIDGKMSSVHPYKCSQTGLDKYMEMELDTRFIDVYADIDLPRFPEEHLKRWSSISDVLKDVEFTKKLPLGNFRFEGLAIVRITEVTEREIINKIKNSLLNIHSFADEKLFGELDYQMQNLACVHQLHTAIKPFFMVNNHLVLSE